jgi:transcription initiation factor IIE alpha subunit
MKEELMIQHTSSGLVCDNPACDYENKEVQVEQLLEWVNVPCPKCGENLLTEDDYDRTMKLFALIDVMNDLTEEELEEIQNSLAIAGVEVPKIDDIEEGSGVYIRVGTHKELSIEVSVKPD